MLKNWVEMIRPKRLEVDAETHSERYGKLVAEPLDRGFGTTLGNSIRRVLLSSIVGAAVTSVRIEGVLHEFLSVPGVREDVTNIILNLKDISLRLHSEGPETITLDADKEGDVKASDIVTGSNVEILNPDLHIATLSRNTKLRMEMVVKKGRGYVPAEKNKDEDMPIGTIPIDAIFSPIRKVDYSVGHARVGQKTDYDKLTLEVWTDGSILPEDGVACAAMILKSQLDVFINFDQPQEAVEEEDREEEDEEMAKPNENLFKGVAELELSVRSANCLKNAEINYIGELVQKTEAEMLKTKNFGRKSLNEIKEILTEMGLSLGIKLPSFVPPNLEVEEEKEAIE